jgi:uncharacterized LabA/DUF88 family protein
MFNSKTPKIEKIKKEHPAIINKLEDLLNGNVHMYIDYANVRPWANKLKWHIQITRLKQFLDSFDNIGSIKFYQGEIVGDDKSAREIAKLDKNNFTIRTKPVKIMRHSIDVSSISRQSADLLKKFIRAALLRKYDIETLEYLNEKFSEMNQRGIYVIEDRKCNFDVEIGVDMLLDFERNDADTFVLWSGDSDFHDPLKTLLENNKKVILFATAGRIARELNELKNLGLIIFDIADIRDFICWTREQARKRK